MPQLKCHYSWPTSNTSYNISKKPFSEYAKSIGDIWDGVRGEGEHLLILHICSTFTYLILFFLFSVNAPIFYPLENSENHKRGFLKF